MKPISLLLGVSVIANVALIAFLGWRGSGAAPGGRADSPAPSAGVASAGTHESAGGDAGAKTTAAAAAKPAWTQMRTDDLKALVLRLREVGFPPDVVRRVIVALVAERYDARRLELERPLLETPFWQQAADRYSDPKVGSELIKLQREQVETTKQILGGTVGDVFAASEEEQAMLRMQLGDIPPDKIDQLYAVAMDYNQQRQKAQAARGQGSMLAADYEKMVALDKTFREDLAKFLTPTEANEFMLRQSPASGQLRNAIAPAQPTEAEYRALYPIYQEYFDRFPGSGAGESPEQAAARRAAQDQMYQQVNAAVGTERGADFKQAGNPEDQQLNRLVARLELPISAATQVAAVRNDFSQQITQLRRDGADTATIETQGQALQQDALKRVTAILGPRGLEAYKQYGGGWLAQRPAPKK